MIFTLLAYEMLRSCKNQTGTYSHCSDQCVKNVFRPWQKIPNANSGV